MRHNGSRWKAERVLMVAFLDSAQDVCVTRRKDIKSVIVDSVRRVDVVAVNIPALVRRRPAGVCCCRTPQLAPFSLVAKEDEGCSAILLLNGAQHDVDLSVRLARPDQ